ncbi:MAG: DUF1080 domain-containing protein, partial [Candidatus Omnitrophica bacterium]|nr:DUF1080 domain-containing protein [Candidatus Omnitrophota bacterium]
MYSYAKADRKRFTNTLLAATAALILILTTWASSIFAEGVSTGPALIAEICAENNITATKDEIAELAASDKGTTSFWGLKMAAEEKGFIAKGLKTDISHLKELADTGYVIVILSENRTYVRVKDVSDWFVNVHNPSGYPKADSISKDEFGREWDGKVLFIQTQEQSQETAPAPLGNQPLAESMEAAALSSEPQVVSLSEGEMQTTEGSNPCANPAGPAGPDNKEETEDPVILTNGNLHSTEADFFIETRGLIPLELTRTYNSQVVSDLEGWQPEGGAGPWAARDGVYNAYGDRNLTTRSWKNFTLTADVKTITPGTNPWEVAWVSFRYTDRDNRYYFIIKTDGILELTRVVNAQMTQLRQKSSSYNPLNWNTIKIEANETNIKIYVNNNLEIDYTDFAPILETKPISLEARYCYAQFDNVRIQSGAENHFYDFNTPDRTEPFGRGWSFNYGVFIKELSNGNVKVIREDGRSDLFVKQVDSSYLPSSWLHETLTKDGSGFGLRKKDGTIYRFNLSGRLEYLEDRFANRITLTYENIYGAERLKYVTDSTNRQFTFEYWPDGRVKEIKDPTGIRKYQYVYTGLNLTQVIDLRGNSKYYEYNPVTNLRTAYIDKEGNRYEYTYTYNARVHAQKDPDLKITTFEYWWDTTWVTNNTGETWLYH